MSQISANTAIAKRIADQFNRSLISGTHDGDALNSVSPVNEAVKAYHTISSYKIVVVVTIALSQMFTLAGCDGAKEPVNNSATAPSEPGQVDANGNPPAPGLPRLEVALDVKALASDLSTELGKLDPKTQAHVFEIAQLLERDDNHWRESAKRQRRQLSTVRQITEDSKRLNFVNSTRRPFRVHVDQRALARLPHLAVGASTLKLDAAVKIVRAIAPTQVLKTAPSVGNILKLLRSLIAEQGLVDKLVNGTLSVDELHKLRPSLVLSGGALHGSFEVGVIARLMKGATKVPFRSVVGTSVGAINGFGISRYGTDAPRRMAEFYYDLLVQEDFVLQTPEHQRFARGLGIDDVLLGNDTCVATNIWEEGGGCLLTEKVGNFFNLPATIEIGLNSMQSLYSLSPIEANLRSALKQTNGYEVPFAAVAVDMRSGRLLTISTANRITIFDKMGAKREATQLTTPMDLNNMMVTGVIGSSAISGMFAMPDLDTNEGKQILADGGFRDGSSYFSLTRSLDVFGTANPPAIIGVRTSPPDSGVKGYRETRDMNWIANIASALQISVDEILRNDPTESRIPFRQLRPFAYVSDGLRVENGLLRANVEYGYMHAHLATSVGTHNLAVSILAALLLQATVEHLKQTVVLERLMRTPIILAAFDPNICPSNGNGTCAVPVPLARSIASDWSDRKGAICETMKGVKELLGSDAIPTFADDLVVNNQTIRHTQMWNGYYDVLTHIIAGMGVFSLPQAPSCSI